MCTQVQCSIPQLHGTVHLCIYQSILPPDKYVHFRLKFIPIQHKSDVYLTFITINYLHYGLDPTMNVGTELPLGSVPVSYVMFCRDYSCPLLF